MDTAHQFKASDNESPEGRLLLWSLADLWSIIEPLLTAAAPKTVCEIGIDRGEFMRLLIEFCARNQCRYAGIDPGTDETLMRNDSAAQTEFFRQPSLATLPTLPAQDVYFLDGDHNYYTVLNELRLIRRWPEHWPLVILHDVGSPWGRRDHYCAPETIPASFRHPYSAIEEMLPQRNDPGGGNFSDKKNSFPHGAMAHEGGPRNGVLTALEDFIREQPAGAWRWVNVPAVFGLGILYAPGKCPAAVSDQIDRLSKALGPLRPLVELLERNRVDLYKQLTGIHAEYEKLHKHSEALLSSYNALMQHADALQQHYDALQKAYGDLARIAGIKITQPPFTGLKRA
jgi:hypothetical protein